MHRSNRCWHAGGSMVGMAALVFVVIVAFITMAVDICRTFAPSTAFNSATVLAQLDDVATPNYENTRALALRFAAGHEHAQASMLP